VHGGDVSKRAHQRRQRSNVRTGGR
jgi:hypothetical protein